MRIAVLALQGAFAEHEQMLQRLGVETFQIRQLKDWQQPKDGLILPGGESTVLRQLKDWQQPKDGLILPGGESTVQMRLLSQLGLHDPIREAILGGLPVFGTCAGMILLSKGYLGTMDILVRRNAYGRQLGSFHTVGTVEGIGKDLPMTFIRAPYIETVLSDACAAAFHPELDCDPRIHQFFLESAVFSRTSVDK